MIPLSIPYSSLLIPTAKTPSPVTLLPPIPCPNFLFKPLLTLRPSPFSPPLRVSTPPAAASAALPVDDFIDKDWSFLDSTSTDSDQDQNHKNPRIIAAGEIRNDSRVLVSMGTANFVDLVVDSSPCELIVSIHDSLLVLAMIKENHDEVRCWKGGISVVPEKFLPFDVVFVCYFPGMGISVDQLMSSVAQRCSPGARLVISCDQGRKIIEQEHRQQYPDMVTSDLPDRTVLEKAAADHLFQITEFVDEPTFYLAVLKFHE